MKLQGAERKTAEKRGGLAPAQQLKLFVPVSRCTHHFSARFLTPLQAQRSPFSADQPWDRGAQPPPCHQAGAQTLASFPSHPSAPRDSQWGEGGRGAQAHAAHPG